MEHLGRDRWPIDLRETTQMFRLDGKVAVITGSTRGLGWSIADAMARQGATVVVNGRTAADVEARVADLVGRGYAASGWTADMADLPVDGLDDVVARHGRLDVLVNNAGINHRAPLAEFGPDDWERVTRVNLDAPFALARRAASSMTAARVRGRIVNIGSIMGTVARPTIPAYVASKGGIDGLTKALAVELGPHGITVNAIGPGYVATELNSPLVNDPVFNAMVCERTPLGRWGDPSEIAAAAVFLASDEASYVNGHKLVVDGGMTIAL
jgi:gluconate 5-dehydrogenase